MNIMHEGPKNPSTQAELEGVADSGNGENAQLKGDYTEEYILNNATGNTGAHSANGLVPPSIAEKRRQFLFLCLAAFFLTNALLAEIIGPKIFSMEALLGIPVAQLSLFGMGPFGFNLTCGALLWPFVFLTTDLINEYFGPVGVKRISWLGVGCIVYMFSMVWLVTKTPPAQFWLDVNAIDDTGKPFNINFAFNSIFRQGLGIMLGSIVAFLVGQFADAYIFQQIRKRTGEGKIWLRATGSTVVSQLLDSFLVLYIAFYVFGNWPLDQVLAVGVVNYIYKFTTAILLTPLLYVAHNAVDRYLGSGKGASISKV
jgi:queuosine precursor transporter